MEKPDNGQEKLLDVVQSLQTPEESRPVDPDGEVVAMKEERSGRAPNVP